MTVTLSFVRIMLYSCDIVSFVVIKINMCRYRKCFVSDLILPIVPISFLKFGKKLRHDIVSSITTDIDDIVTI